MLVLPLCRSGHSQPAECRRVRGTRHQAISTAYHRLFAGVDQAAHRAQRKEPRDELDCAQNADRQSRQVPGHHPGDRLRVAVDRAAGVDLLRTDAANQRPDSRHPGRRHLGDGPERAVHRRRQAAVRKRLVPRPRRAGRVVGGAALQGSHPLAAGRRQFSTDDSARPG